MSTKRSPTCSGTSSGAVEKADRRGRCRIPTHCRSSSFQAGEASHEAHVPPSLHRAPPSRWKEREQSLLENPKCQHRHEHQRYTQLPNTTPRENAPRPSSGNWLAYYHAYYGIHVMRNVRASRAVFGFRASRRGEEACTGSWQRGDAAVPTIPQVFGFGFRHFDSPA